MTGPEHYLEAQNRLRMAWEEDRDPQNTQHLLAEEQVHATLALAAATALSNPDQGSLVAHVNADSSAWREAAGVPSKNSEPVGNVS
ncbi:hypothetical protein [Streptomyces sp. NPDC101249]|uniref:hypothetical protein n=1 Tax=Streptomyces sp. NPDC101249 TaxID=3366140 RepID=UPI0038142EF4